MSLVVGQASGPGAMKAAQFVVVGAVPASLPQGRQLTGSASEIVVTDSGAGNAVTLTAGALIVQTDQANTWTVGSQIIQTAVDTVTAFQVLDADGGAPVLVVDTVNEWVGIGTQPSIYKLEVSVGSSSVTRFSSSNNNSWIVNQCPNNRNAGFLFRDAADAENVFRGRVHYDISANEMQLWTDGTRRFYIDATGNVLINGFTAVTIGQIIKLAAAQTANAFEVQNSAGGVTFHVNEDGYLGIGIGSNPLDSQQFHVYDDSGTASVKIQDVAANGKASIKLQNDAETWEMRVDGGQGDSYVLYRAGGAGYSPLLIAPNNETGRLIIGGSTVGVYTICLDNTSVAFMARGAAAQTAALFQLQDSTTGVVVDSGHGLTGSTWVHNEGGIDIDFRVESVNEVNAILVDAGSDAVVLGVNTTIGTGVAGVDYTLTWNGETNDGVLTWMEDEARLDFVDDVAIAADSKGLFLGAAQDMDIGYDGTDGYLKTDLVAASDLNLDCGANKTLELQTTVWKDINIGSAMLSKPAASQPDEEQFTDEAGDVTGIYTLGFAIGEKVSGNFEIQHDYAEGTDFVFHAHWQGIAAPSGTDNVQWRITYAFMRDDTTLDVPTITDSADTPIDTQYESYKSNIVTIDGATAGNNGSGVLIGDQFIFTLERVAATGDVYLGDALVASVGMHYEVNTMGSRQIGTK